MQKVGEKMERGGSVAPWKKREKYVTLRNNSREQEGSPT
jgi:hypothetical protein